MIPVLFRANSTNFDTYGIGVLAECLAQRFGTPQIDTAAPYGSAMENLKARIDATLLLWIQKPYSDSSSELTTS